MVILQTALITYVVFLITGKMRCDREKHNKCREFISVTDSAMHCIVQSTPARQFEPSSNF